MGAAISYLRSNGDGAPTTVIDPVLLEQDLQIARAEISNKETVIQFLLQSIGSSLHYRKATIQVKEQHLVLKTAIDQIKKENLDIKKDLRSAEAAIAALSTSCVPTSEPHSTSTSFSHCSDSTANSGIATEDLIDLIDYSEESDNGREATTVYDELSEDESNIEGDFKNVTPAQSLYQSSDLEFDASSYIVHFADSHEESKPDSIEIATKHIPMPCETSDLVTSTPEYSPSSMAIAESGASSPEDSCSLNRHVSTSPSSLPCAENTASLEIAGTEYLDKALSQWAAFSSKGNGDWNMDRCVALAETLPSITPHRHVRPMAPASSKPKALPQSGNASEIEPHWSISETFSSVKEREDAADINRYFGGPKGPQYPGIFKYGIHFSPSYSQQELYRTVIVSNLSPNANLGALLAQVRGGLVVDAKLLDTVKLTGQKSAMITFLTQKAAAAFLKYAKNNPILINGIAAKLPTPTYPIRISLRKAILEHHHTRCLKIIYFPKGISPQQLHVDLNPCLTMKPDPDRITYIHKGADNILELHFSSVDKAGHAYRVLSSSKAYRGCTPLFAPDPCARPLGETASLETPQMGCFGGAETATECATAPAAEPIPVDQSGRLDKVEWESDAEQCRGRGFAT